MPMVALFALPPQTFSCLSVDITDILKSFENSVLKLLFSIFIFEAVYDSVLEMRISMWVTFHTALHYVPVTH